MCLLASTSLEARHSSMMTSMMLILSLKMFSYNSWRAWLSGLHIWFDVPRLLGATGWGNGMMDLTLTSVRTKQNARLCKMWFLGHFTHPLYLHLEIK